jgi:hypothetical protein
MERARREAGPRPFMARSRALSIHSFHQKEGKSVGHGRSVLWSPSVSGIKISYRIGGAMRLQRGQLWLRGYELSTCNSSLLNLLHHLPGDQHHPIQLFNLALRLHLQCERSAYQCLVHLHQLQTPPLYRLPLAFSSYSIHVKQCPSNSLRPSKLTQPT